MTSHDLTVVFRRGIPFEFPQEIMDACRLRPNQKVSSRLFWKALVLEAQHRLEDMPLGDDYAYETEPEEESSNG